MRILARRREAGRLDWCRRSCGKSVHRHCFAMWATPAMIGQRLARTAVASGRPPTRGRTGSIGNGLRRRRRRRGAEARPAAGGGGSGGQAPSARLAAHRDARCKSCRCMPIVGTRYRCLVCPEKVELCSECFRSCMHPHHPFASRERPSSKWLAAPCRAAERQQVDPEGAADTNSSGRGSGATADGTPLEEALAALQHREITPEDYDLLMALSQTGPSSSPSQPAGARRYGSAAALSSCGERDQAGAACNACLRLFCTMYQRDATRDRAQRLDAATAARKAAADAPTVSYRRPFCPDGFSRPCRDGTDGAVVATRGGAAFGSSGARPWQQHRSATAVAADRAAAARMALVLASDSRISACLVWV